MDAKIIATTILLRQILRARIIE